MMCILVSEGEVMHSVDVLCKLLTSEYTDIYDDIIDTILDDRKKLQYFILECS